MPQSPLVRLSIDPSNRTARPGERAEFVITLENTGPAPQKHSVELTGLPDAWYDLSYDTAQQVSPGESRVGTLTISIPDSTESGLHDFDVSVLSGAAESSVSGSIEVLASLSGPPSLEDAIPPEPAVEEPVPNASPISPESARPVVSLEAGLIIWYGGEQQAVRKVLSVRNPGGAEADYRLEVQGLDPAWHTLLDRVRVGPGQELQTDFSVHPPAGARVQDYPYRIYVARDGDPDRVEVLGWLSIQASGFGQTMAPPATVGPVAPDPMAATASGERIPPPDVTLSPKASFSFNQTATMDTALITVTNQGKVRERYSIEVSGIPEDWYRLSDDNLRLDPSESRQISLRLNPETGPGLPAGEYEFLVRALPDGMPDYYGQALGRLSIAGVATYEARLETLSSQGMKKQFSLRVENVGDMALTMAVEAWDSEGKCKFKLPAPRDLHPGQVGLLPIKVGTRRIGIIGPPEYFDFRLRLRDDANNARTSRDTFDARLIHTPRLSYRMAFVAGFMCALVGLVFLLIWLLTPVVEDGANWVGCQLDSDYRLAPDAAFKKEICGGEPYDDTLDGWLRERRNLYRPAPTDVSQLIHALVDAEDVLGIPEHGLQA